MEEFKHEEKRNIILVAVMLFAFTAGVVAAPAVQQITATLATDFKFTLDGKLGHQKMLMALLCTPLFTRSYLFTSKGYWRSFRNKS